MGGQFNSALGPYAQYMMENFAGYKIDLVVAGHSHTPLPCKRFSTGTIGAFSLGNCCFTPGVGIWIDKVLSEYGIVLNVFVDKSSKTISRATFSIIESVVDEDGYSRSVIASDLIESMNPGPNLETLIKEYNAVYQGFTGECNSNSIKKRIQFDPYLIPIRYIEV